MIQSIAITLTQEEIERVLCVHVMKMNPHLENIKFVRSKATINDDGRNYIWQFVFKGQEQDEKETPW